MLVPRLGWPSGRSWVIAAIFAILCFGAIWLFGEIGMVLVVVLGVAGLAKGANQRTEELAEKWSEPQDKP